MSGCLHGVDEQRCIECNPMLARAVAERLAPAALEDLWAEWRDLGEPVG